MISKYLNNWLKSYNYSIVRLFLTAFFIFSIISYSLVQDLLNNIKSRGENKLDIIENFITSSIDNANQVMYGLSLSMAQESIDINNKNIVNLIKSFDHKMERHKSIPFYAFKIIDQNNIVIRHTLIPDKLFTPLVVINDLKILEEARKNPFELQLGEVRLHTFSHEEIIPLCMAIKNNNKHTGTICSGLLVDKLASRLHSHLASKHINSLNFLNLGKEDNGNRINNSLTFTNILGAYFRDKNLIIHQPLTAYPMLLEAEINCYYLSREIGAVIFYCMCYFILFAVSIYYLLEINKKFYQAPFNKVQKKLYEYSNNFIDQMPEFYRSHLHDFCPVHLSEAINHIIDYCALLCRNAKSHSLEKPTAELRNNILHLILTEHHYCTSSKINDNDIGAGDLYLNELKRQINSKEQSFNLKKFLEEVVQYCMEYYHELKVKLIIEEKHSKNFSVKHAYLTETIFSILTIIVRIGKFDTDAELVLRAGFDNNTSPSISIETSMHDSSLQPLGWEFGPAYIYTGLLPIYLLAKENNFFFSIKQKDNKIIFLLEPVDNERLQNANDLCTKLPFNLFLKPQ